MPAWHGKNDGRESNPELTEPPTGRAVYTRSKAVCHRLESPPGEAGSPPIRLDDGKETAEYELEIRNLEAAGGSDEGDSEEDGSDEAEEGVNIAETDESDGDEESGTNAIRVFVHSSLERGVIAYSTPLSQEPSTSGIVFLARYSGRNHTGEYGEEPFREAIGSDRRQRVGKRSVSLAREGQRADDRSRYRRIQSEFLSALL